MSITRFDITKLILNRSLTRVNRSQVDQINQILHYVWNYCFGMWLHLFLTCKLHGVSYRGDIVSLGSTGSASSSKMAGQAKWLNLLCLTCQPGRSTTSQVGPLAQYTYFLKNININRYLGFELSLCIFFKNINKNLHIFLFLTLPIFVKKSVEIRCLILSWKKAISMKNKLT